MRRRRVFIVLIIVLLLGGGYVVFTLQSGQELQEASPLDPPASTGEPAPVFQDKLDTMSSVEKEQFMAEVEKMKATVMARTDTMPVQARLLAQGDFRRRFHSVEGRALLIAQGDEHILRFEDFQTDNGPRLHIYLSRDRGDEDFIDLGPIKATRGNVNYQVPAGVDFEKYQNVLVWCKPFGVLFSYATLTPL